MKERILLIGRNEKYLVEIGRGSFGTKSGVIDLAEVKKRRIGDKIKTHLGKVFRIVEPSLKDLFEKGFKRGAQVILPKDAALILAYTGIKSKSKVVDAGTGTGYLSIFLANYLSKGKVVTYEKDRRFIRIAQENIKLSGLKNIILKEGDVTKGFEEKNVDLVTLDLKEAKKVIKHAHRALKFGGYLAIYCPTVNELLEVLEEIERFSFSKPIIVESIVREWKYEKTLRPKTKGLMHTGFLVFTRKV